MSNAGVVLASHSVTPKVRIHFVVLEELCQVLLKSPKYLMFQI